MTIQRIWHGWTTHENADAYQRLLLEHIFPSIAAKNAHGCLGSTLLRRQLADEVEFVTIHTFDSLQSVIAFQGEDYTQAYVPDVARAVLKRWDDRATHYEVQADQRYE